MIRVENISKSFQDEKVLENISFHVKEGECVVLSGVSGSGKSTLLSIIATFLKPSAGKVLLDTLDVVALNDFDVSALRAKKVGFIAQSFHLFDLLNVRDNIVPGLLISDLSDKEIKLRVQEVMKMASIEHKEKSIVGKLSGGEKQRCMIARALVNDPEIILCDEPTANLDKENALKFAQIIKELKERGKTIIIATHDPLISELEFIDKIIKIDGGKVE